MTLCWPVTLFKLSASKMAVIWWSACVWRFTAEGSLQRLIKD